MKSKITILLLVLCTPTFAKNYAVMIAGWTTAMDEPLLHHEFALDSLRAGAGLAKGGWETTLLYSPNQGRTRFHESATVAANARAENVATANASKEKLFETIRALKEKVGRGDKVYLSLNAHGVNRDGTFVFSLVGERGGFPDGVTAEELEAALADLKSTGAQVALTLNSCHSGDIPAPTLAKLRDNACLITSSYEDTHAEACMENDYDAQGRLIHPDNKSATSMGSFVSSWMHARGGTLTTNPFTNPTSHCWAAVQSHYLSCLAKAANTGIRLTANSSLKDVMRAGRFCDESVNMPDSTGRGRALGAIIPELGRNSMEHLYGSSNGGRFAHHQINPFAVEHLIDYANNGARALAAAPAATDAYGRALQTAVARNLAEYRTNLARQKHLLDEHKAVMERAIDAATFRRLIGDSYDFVSGLSHQSFLRSYPSQRDPSTPRIPEPKVEEDRRTAVVALLQAALMANDTPPAHRERIAAALRDLNGGDAGAARLREIVELRNAQHKLFEDFVAKERVAFEATVARERDSCNDFNFQ